jgi:hypothetical protein
MYIGTLQHMFPLKAAGLRINTNPIIRSGVYNAN